MMTAYAIEDLVQEALQEGAYGVVYKPLDIEKMINLIEETQKTQRGALILVVDDDPGTCVTLKHILSTKGYQVGTAYTGEEAIATARKVTHDIIFIDVKLPTINGLETYLAIREINPQAVVILLTAYRQEVAELVQEAIRHSAYSCLYKPLDIEALLELVYEICQRKQKGA
jgi:DNA-binding NtrC family response regulator